MELLTNSRLKSFRACQRMHHLRYDLGVRAVADAESLAFGTAIHAALEAWWLAVQARAESPLAAALAALSLPDPWAAVRAEIMVIAYDTRWLEWARRCEVIAVEAEFRLPLWNPARSATSRTYELAGKMDALIRLPADEGSRIAVVEHKTSSEDASPGSRYRARLTMDGQVSMYFDGADALGYPAEACVYDVLRKPTIKPLLATPIEARKFTKDGRLYATQRDRDESLEEYRARLLEWAAEHHTDAMQHAEIVRLDGELDDHREDVWNLATQMREAATKGRAPRNPDACERYGRLCDYFAACTGTASIDDPALYQRGEVHPELAPAT